MHSIEDGQEGVDVPFDLVVLPLVVINHEGWQITMGDLVQGVAGKLHGGNQSVDHVINKRDYPGVIAF